MDDEMAACEHRNTWFDRSLCFCEAGGVMHTVCDDCGVTLDGGCADPVPGEAVRLVGDHRLPAFIISSPPEEQARG